MSKKTTVLELLNKYINNSDAIIRVNGHPIKRFALWSDGGGIIELNECVSVDDKHGHIRSFSEEILNLEPGWYEAESSFGVIDERGKVWTFAIEVKHVLTRSFIHDQKTHVETSERLRKAIIKLSETAYNSGKKSASSALSLAFEEAKREVDQCLVQLWNF